MPSADWTQAGPAASVSISLVVYQVHACSNVNLGSSGLHYTHRATYTMQEVIGKGSSETSDLEALRYIEVVLEYEL